MEQVWYNVSNNNTGVKEMQLNLFAEENRLEKLSKLGDSLKKLKIIDWEMFRPELTDALR